jgi:hypothetical protein
MPGRLRRVLVTISFVAFTWSMALVPAAAGRAQRDVQPVGWHPQTGLGGAVAPGAVASLVRRADGVSFAMRTSALRPGHAYTVWFVVINNPAACASSPCSGPDMILNPATRTQISYATGHVVGAAGRAGFGGAVRTGPIPEGWLPGTGLEAPLSAEIQLVLNDHGPVLRGYLPEMIHTYRAGCTEASIPAIFPATARADGTPGPNSCQLYQVAVFAAP